MALILNGDCLELMKDMADNSVDSIVTDPPYGLSFMGKKWDYDVPSTAIWREVLRVLKPGGHLLAFSGSRTYHRMVVNIEDAGFDIRDQIMWIYGSGFPKSHNISKAIDKEAGYEGEVVGKRTVDVGIQSGSMHTGRKSNLVEKEVRQLSPEAQAWEGWGTALKPAHEPIVLARKPLIGTIADNVLAHGTGGLNIDASRIEGEKPLRKIIADNQNNEWKGKGAWKSSGLAEGTTTEGRFPANIIHDGSDEVVDNFPYTESGDVKPHHVTRESVNQSMEGKNYAGRSLHGWGDAGSAARFFYCAKTSKSERNAGLEAFEDRKSQYNAGGIGRKVSVEKRLQQGNVNASMMKNIHPTVKPIALMEYLVRLITPPGGVVLDPFMGSGTTGIAALRLGFGFIGCELDKEYTEIATARIAHWADMDLDFEGEDVVMQRKPQAEWL